MSASIGSGAGEVPDLSISIVNYNTKDLTRQCLASIIENTHVSFEVFVIDNASKDGSLESLESEFPQFTVIGNAVNVGLAAATNQGLSKSRGRYVMALNSDTVMTPSALDRLVQFLDEHSEVGGVTPRLVGPEGSAHPPFCGKIPTLKMAIDEAASPMFSKDRSVDDVGVMTDYSNTCEVECVLWGTAFVIRKSVYDQIGGQDERFFIYAEDVDWSMRITKAGWKIFFVADSEVIHYGGQSTKQASTKMLGFLWKSKCRLIGKHYGVLSGLLLRATIISVCMFRLSKWVVLSTFRRSCQSHAKMRIDGMRAIIDAAITP